MSLKYIMYNSYHFVLRLTGLLLQQTEKLTVCLKTTTDVHTKLLSPTMMSNKNTVYSDSHNVQ